MDTTERETQEVEGYSYLTIESGPRSGTNYLLDPTSVNRMGRGIDCDVVLSRSTLLTRARRDRHGRIGLGVAR